MREKFILSKQDIGDAIIQWIAIQKGIVFFPYRIVNSNLIPPTEINVEIDYVPRGSFKKDYPHNLSGGKQ